MVSSNLETNINLGQENDFTGSNVITGSTIKGPVYQTIIAADESYQVSGESPYYGLKSYTIKDSESYAGRDHEVEKTVRLLAISGAQPSLLFVVGASGSGKSSFVQAGLLSNLQKLYQEDNYIVRPFAVIRPGINPCDEFYEHILQKWSIKPSEKCSITQSINIISENTDKSSVNIIVIDQFEEVWTRSNPEQGHKLLEALQTLPSFDQWRTHIIITLRSDFIHKLYPYKKLYDFATKSCVVELRPMTSSELKSAIERPLHMRYPDKSKRWEERLLTELTQVAAGHDDALPLLQVLLNQIWQTKKLWISEPKYFDQSISNHAEEIYATYSAEQQIQIMQLLIELVKLGDEPRQDVRQRCTIDELCGTSAEKRQLMNDLVDARLLAAGIESRGENKIEVVDIIHETLLTNWPRLQEAIAKNRTLLQQRLQFKKRLRKWEFYIKQSLQGWEAHNQSDDYLLVGVRLAEAETLVKMDDIAVLSENAKEMVRRSVAQRERQLRNKVRNQRFTIILLTVLFVIAVPFLFQSLKSLYYQHTVGTQLISVPSGKALIGRGRVPIELESFRIEQFEVSQYQYRMCVDHGSCDRPLNRVKYDDVAFDSYPISYISAQQAFVYCEWIGRRLPTTIEWQRVVHGTQNRKWPWGEDELTPKLANVGTSGSGYAALPVETELDGTTPADEGKVAHLVGNVAEFVVEALPDCSKNASSCHYQWDGSTAHQISTIGGHYRSIRSTTILQPNPVAPTNTDEFTGFRCADN